MTDAIQSCFSCHPLRQKDKSAVSPEQMIKPTEELREEFDYVLLDCPAGIEQGFKNAVAGADKALVVTTPEVSAIRDADRIIGLLEAGGLRYPSDHQPSETGYDRQGRYDVSGRCN